MFKKTVFAIITLYSLNITQLSYALTPFSATYQFSYNNKNVGDATRQLRQISPQNNTWQYQFSSKIPLIGKAIETSTFHLNQGQIDSLSFQRQTQILFHKDLINLEFKPQQKQIITQRKGEQRVLIWKNGVLDDLNAELQVREDLQHLGKIKPSYWIADYKEVDARQFVNDGQENVLAADGKRYDTIKVRLKHNKTTRNTIFWLAPSLDYLPVKVAHQDDDTTYGLLLKIVQ